MKYARYLVVGFAPFLLAACSPSDHSVLVDACLETGQSKKDCTCVADIAEDKLSKEIFASVAKVARTDTDKSRAFLETLSVDDSLALVLVATEAATSCKISGLDWLLP